MSNDQRQYRQPLSGVLKGMPVKDRNGAEAIRYFETSLLIVAVMGLALIAYWALL